jgi:hypothetical protein
MVRILLVILLGAASVPCTGQQMKTENVVIVTLDGYRWRELFGGADKKILFKERYTRDTVVQSDYWAPTERQRRELLMPFLWNVIGKEGQLYGNRKFDNKMRCSNGNFYSYSGYSEMFVGFHDRRVKNNDPKPNPNVTVLEALNKNREFKNSVAAFSTWQTMTHILREETSGIPVNSGSDKAYGKNLRPREIRLNRTVEHHKNPHGDRFDKYTFQYALEYMKRKHPRVVFISFDETDEHAHDGRYDAYLKAANAADRMIADLWSWLQTDEQYKGKTTLIITTDHGRGTSAKGWRHHRILFRGSGQTWMAVLGPDTPATGEVKGFMRLKQNQIAATIARFLNFPYKNEQSIGEPILSAFLESRLSEAENTTADKQAEP